MGKMIIIASGKGGTGKTTLTSQVGTALANMGYLTALVDADAGFRNLDIALGLESQVVFRDRPVLRRDPRNQLSEL